jgi:predicted ATPase
MALPVREVSAAGYRSLKAIHYPMSQLDVFVGANGVGKSNLYRGLELLRAAAENSLGDALGQEGFRQALWAGPGKHKTPARLRLSAGFSDVGGSETAYRYEVELGYPALSAAAFGDEAHVKSERLVYLGGRRPATLMERDGARLMARGEDGRPSPIEIDLLDTETAFGRIEDPARFPALDVVRRTLLQWRFYHDLRTDAQSALRQPCAAAPAVSLASDGRNLAAVFATLAHICEDTVALEAAVDRAFPGATLNIPQPGRFASFSMSFPEFPMREFEAAELSDGTLKFLALAGALLAYRLPPFIALNEPESSLHPDLMEPLAGLIAQASKRSQIWLVTHSERLAQAIGARGGGAVRTVLKKDGATVIDGLTMFGAFRDDDD